MDDGHRLGRGVAERVDMSHHVVAELLFVARGGVVIDVVEMLTHLVELLVGDR